MIDKAKEYINKYDKQSRTSTYLFPILHADRHMLPIQKNNRVRYARKKVNHELRLIGNELKIETKITTYVARHSFAIIKKKLGCKYCFNK